jgi:hypothetical protein
VKVAHDDSERWPVVSLDDNRSTAARLNRPFGAAPWHPRDPDNWRIFKGLIEVRNRERAMAEAEGREWRGLNSRQYAYRLKVAGFFSLTSAGWTKTTSSESSAFWHALDDVGFFLGAMS